ncbi:MAG: hypothetical protein RR610_21345 [Citrobacter sp.]
MHVYQTEPTHTLDMNATAEAERAYWLTREKAAVTAPVEIDVYKFHDAAGMMPSLWRRSKRPSFLKARKHTDTRSRP